MQDCTSFMQGYSTLLTIGIVITVLVAIVTIISNWKIYLKAGRHGWASIVPVYNIIVLLKIVGLTPYLVFILLAYFIPYVGPLLVLAFNIYLTIKLGLAFHKGAGFIVGMLLLPIVFLPILAFGKSEYDPAYSYDRQVA